VISHLNFLTLLVLEESDMVGDRCQIVGCHSLFDFLILNVGTYGTV
jgi:hypothetical protein